MWCRPIPVGCGHPWWDIWAQGCPQWPGENILETVLWLEDLPPAFLPSPAASEGARPVSQAEGSLCSSSFPSVSASLSHSPSGPGVCPWEDGNSQCSISNFAHSKPNQPAPPSPPKPTSLPPPFSKLHFNQWQFYLSSFSGQKPWPPLRFLCFLPRPVRHQSPWAPRFRARPVGPCSPLLPHLPTRLSQSPPSRVPCFTPAPPPPAHSHILSPPFRVFTQVPPFPGFPCPAPPSPPVLLPVRAATCTLVFKCVY